MPTHREVIEDMAATIAALRAERAAWEAERAALQTQVRQLTNINRVMSTGLYKAAAYISVSESTPTDGAAADGDERAT